MEFCLLIHYHELSLKKGNRKWFEDRFISNVHKHLKGLPFSKIKLVFGRVIVHDINPSQDCVRDELCPRPIIFPFATATHPCRDRSVDFVDS